ncbi:transcriptional regulator GutM [Chelativorans sp.]|uniref:transcriptional regulator GutM n=1 Tax=Chelativorans sp. TaxID=2203393 RepID=UPI002812099D|nr:transcriptional regulator GutM [Chelativorans sp.]
MAMWQWALLLLAVVWALQAFGVWLQMRHYSDVFKGITNRFSDGYVGTGVFHGRLRKGAIAIVVVSPDLELRRVLVMYGRSVFTKFSRYEQFEGIPLDRLRQNPAVLGEKERGVTEAVRQAIRQIDDKREQEYPPRDLQAAAA